MNKPTGSEIRVASPLKAWASRFALLLLVGAAFGLMLIGRTNSFVVEETRTAVTDMVTPILNAVSQPVKTFSGVIDQAEALANLRSENLALKEQNARLLQWQAVARRLEAENAALRSLNRMVPDPAMSYISARVVGDPGGAFVRTVLINAGERDGVEKGQAAVTADGLAGRIAEVGKRSARVLLLTDINSRVPVVVGDGRDRAVLAGDNTNAPELLYLGPTAKVQLGDRVTTSGHGGVFPPGLPIGVVAGVGEKGIRVKPFVDWSHMEMLRIVDYEMTGILDFEAQVGAARAAAAAGTAQ
ncbi:rod shape-determining protein MreC [Pelagibius sp. CAU 1746]|uniref:rod shape-determining protein MreC n=1 Tax=Pelagibius sp. CAU 1746 TaxID=3140370 RepID=UPI00325B6411